GTHVLVLRPQQSLSPVELMPSSFTLKRVKIDAGYHGGPGFPSSVDVIQKNLVPQVAWTGDLHVVTVNSFKAPIVLRQAEDFRLRTAHHCGAALTDIRVTRFRIAPENHAAMIVHIVNKVLNGVPVLLPGIRIGQTT